MFRPLPSEPLRIWLGTHLPHWLGKTDVPLFLSRRQLAGRKTFPVASGPVAIDSGGFTEISQFGRYTVTAKQYAAEVVAWSHAIGRVEWAAPQDWMCEPFVLEKTGLTVAEHQRRTIASYLELQELAPSIHWIPVLQGWEPSDYFNHVAQYARAGVDLCILPLVGIGSVCRRQHTAEAEGVIFELARHGIRLHGFGFKLKGLARAQASLVSSDSLAWSREARWLGHPICGSTTHQNCANCLLYALHWLAKAHTRLRETPYRQSSLFDHGMEGALTNG